MALLLMSNADDQNAGIILAGLLKVKDVSLRSEIEKGLSQLAASIAIKGGSVAVRDALLKLLVANLDSVSFPLLVYFHRTGVSRCYTLLPQTYAFDDTCTEFFSLLARLLRLKTDESPAGVDIASLLSRLSALVSAHPIVEVTVEQEDFLLRGLLATCASLLSAYPALKLSVGSLVREVRVHAHTSCDGWVLGVDGRYTFARFV